MSGKDQCGAILREDKPPRIASTPLPSTDSHQEVDYRSARPFISKRELGEHRLAGLLDCPRNDGAALLRACWSPRRGLIQACTGRATASTLAPGIKEWSRSAGRT